MLNILANNKATFKLIVLDIKSSAMNENNKTSQDPENTGSQDNTDNLKGSNKLKDPDNWTTGDEPMTGAQESYLKTLSDEAGEDFDETLSKTEASKRIDELQHKTGRGLGNKE